MKKTMQKIGTGIACSVFVFTLAFSFSDAFMPSLGIVPLDVEIVDGKKCESDLTTAGLSCVDKKSNSSDCKEGLVCCIFPFAEDENEDKYHCGCANPKKQTCLNVEVAD